MQNYRWVTVDELQKDLEHQPHLYTPWLKPALNIDLETLCSQLLISVLSFIVVISVLVAVHEWGHFFVARRFGIKVLRFSIGFGRPFFRWYDKLGTEYVLSAFHWGVMFLYMENEKLIFLNRNDIKLLLINHWVFE